MKTTLKHLLLMVALISGNLFPYYTFSQETETDSNPGNTDKYGSNPANCKLNLSEYIELYRQNKLNEAYIPWSTVFRECPKSSKNLYIDGQSLLWNKIGKTYDQSVKSKYGDTLMKMYDLRIKYFGEEGKVLGQKGLDFYKIYPDKKAEALNLLTKSMQIEGPSSDIKVITVLFQIASELTKEKGMTDELFLENYDKISNIISAQMNEKPDSLTLINLQKAQKNIDNILSLSDKATCEKIIPFFTKKYESKRDDISNLKTIARFLLKQNCTDSQLYKEVTEKIQKADPSWPSDMNSKKQ